MSGAARAAPPLAEAVDVGIVERHLGIDAPDRPAPASKPEAELGLFPRDERGVVAAHFVKRRDPHQRVAAAGLRLADGRIPFGIDQTIVDRRLGKAFAPAPTDHGRAGGRVEEVAGRFDPAGLNLAIAVDELDIGRRQRIRLGGCQTGVSGAGGGEALRGIESHDLGPARLGLGDAAIGRATVDVDEVIDVAQKRLEAADQARALVPADDDRSDARARRHPGAKG